MQPPNQLTLKFIVGTLLTAIVPTLILSGLGSYLTVIKTLDRVSNDTIAIKEEIAKLESLGQIKKENFVELLSLQYSIKELTKHSESMNIRLTNIEQKLRKTNDNN